MTEESDDPDEAADRLGAALDRIARAAAIAPMRAAPTPDAELSIPQIAERLDQLIVRLRAALDQTAKPG
jgi:hypothetical protein